MLTVVYHLLSRGVEYEEFGADYFDRRDKAKAARRLIRRLEELGMQVEVRPAA